MLATLQVRGFLEHHDSAAAKAPGLQCSMTLQPPLEALAAPTWPNSAAQSHQILESTIPWCKAAVFQKATEAWHKALSRPRKSQQHNAKLLFQPSQPPCMPPLQLIFPFFLLSLLMRHACPGPFYFILLNLLYLTHHAI